LDNVAQCFHAALACHFHIDPDISGLNNCASFHCQAAFCHSMAVGSVATISISCFLVEPVCYNGVKTRLMSI
jgi:hypothetical protein